MSERTIQVGLAGFGMSGQVFHAPFISADPRFTLKKVYERTTDKAKHYGRYYDNFYHALRSGGELLVKPEEAVDVLRIVEAAQESQDQKQRIRLKSVIRKEALKV